MKSGGAHPGEQELLMAIDRELPAAALERVQRHLGICRTCRDRSWEIERTMANFVWAREEEIEAQALPPIGWARGQFKAELSRLALHEYEKPSGLNGNGFAARLAHLAAALLFAAGAWLIASHQFHLVSQRGYEPRAGLTPGDVVLLSKEKVCRADVGSQPVGIPASLQQAVFREYGMAGVRPQDYELDYLITPQLGGATSLRNLWPEPYSAKWNARVKDQLEDRLHEMVCQGQLDLRTAQHDIAVDWVSAYRKYFHASQPLIAQ